DQLYLNRLAGPVHQEPAGMFGQITLRSLWEMEVPDDANLLGIQAALWCEFIPDRTTLFYHLLPRLLAVADIAWCGTVQGTFEQFVERVISELEYFRASGVPYREIVDAHEQVSAQ